MDFSLTDDQRAFADTAAALFGDHCSDEALRAHDVGDAPFMQAAWREAVQAGLHGVIVPEEAGGLGMGMTDLMPVLQAQGRALALVPLWEHALATAVLARFGGAAHEALAEQAAAGDNLLMLSLADANASRGLGLRLQRDGEGWRMQGRVGAVPLAAQAARVLLPAQVDGLATGQAEGGVRWVVVDPARMAQNPGRTQHHLAVADLATDGLSLQAHDVLPPEALAWAEPRAIAALAALQLGVTERQLERTVEYVSQRKQFGRPIGSFQLVAGQLADGWMALEALRSSLWQVVYRLDAGLGVQAQALALRVQACDCGHRTGHTAQHVHGGIGVDLTYPIHRHLYWSRALSAALGGSEAHLERLGDWLADNDRLGWKYDLPEDAKDL
ncbi:MAG: acyl-CoA dehydrogenase family protein [Betaproteobacteria bacterium]|jgi:alkylation response protein AidB-like acyl-CoA dehydrogenase